MFKMTKKNDAHKKTKKEPRFLQLKGFLSFFILHELWQKKLSGEDLAKIIGKRKGSQLTPGTIYPALKRLRKHKLVKYSRQGREKQYILTQEGKEELKSFYSHFGRFFSGLKSKVK
jgi:DNA-binding PadR family transcriptional regulator